MSKLLKKLLVDKLPSNILSQLVGSYDIVGDIAVIIIPEPLLPWKETIGQTLLDSHPNIKVVAMRAGNYQGEYRILPIDVIAGENRSTTEVKEAGVRLRFDLSTSYYSVRSGGERLRIAGLIEEGEKVLVAFSGIGPYPLVISKHSSASKIIGIEKNKEAHIAALGNLRLNKKCRNIWLHNADIINWATEYEEKFDRIIMPLPKDGRRFLDCLIPLLNPDGYLHFYDMQAVGEFENSLKFLEKVAVRIGRQIKTHKIVSAGHTSPYTHRICIDAQLS
ncbi:MAG: hypothetical protein OCC45_16015 [Desulfotalea sp.]